MHHIPAHLDASPDPFNSCHRVRWKALFESWTFRRDSLDSYAKCQILSSANISRELLSRGCYWLVTSPTFGL